MKTLFLASKFSVVTDAFVTHVALRPGAKVAFIPTAADEYEIKPWLHADRQALVALGMAVEDCDIKNKTAGELYDILKEKDALFVAGGNTFYLLYHARLSGFDEVVTRLVDEGKIYIGSSAGSVLVGPTIEPVKMMDDPNVAPNLKSFAGLGLVDFVVLPHYGDEKYEEQYQSILREWLGKVEIRLLRDSEAIFVENNNCKVLFN